MRRTPILAIFLTFTLVTAVSAELAVSPGRNHRVGAGQGAGEEPQEPLTEAAILESFGDIVRLIWSSEERGAWNDADTDAEKQAFAAAFWAERDPTPSLQARDSPQGSDQRERADTHGTVRHRRRLLAWISQRVTAARARWRAMPALRLIRVLG